MKYGDMVRWKNDDPLPPEPVGRFMYVAPDPKGTIFSTVICIVAAPGTDWEIGLTCPVAETELEVVPA